MLVYYTRNRDTPASIADKFGGGDDGNLAKCICEINDNSRANHLMAGDFYAPHRPVLVPISSTRPMPPEAPTHITSQLDRLTPSEHFVLARLQHDHHIDPVTLAYAQNLAVRANRRMGAGEHEPWFDLIAEKATDFGSSIGEFTQRRCDKFLSAVDELKGRLLAYRTAAGLEENNPVAKLRTQFGLEDVFEDLHDKFKHEIKLFNIERELAYKDCHTLEHRALQEGMKILHTDEVDSVVKLAKHLKWLGHGFFLATAVTDIVEITEAIKHHKPWLKMALEDVAEVGVQVAAAALVGLVFVAGGWVVAVGAAATEVALNFGGDKLIQLIGRHT